MTSQRPYHRVHPRRRLLATALLACVILTLLVAGAALAAPPSVIDPVTGASPFQYQDLADSGAKLEGGYNAFESGDQYTTNPHGGYDSTTNKCKTCHAVHRAEGAYYLLRADSMTDACDYCHIGGSAHSALVVYSNAPGGDPTAATNGHTVGNACEVPDSSVYQYADPVTLSSVDCDGNPIEETINVRAYDPDKISLYRFSRHHSQGEVGTGRSGFLKIGPLALSCQNCHQPHNATAQVWRPRTFTAFDGTNYSTAVDGPFATAGYKLLRRYPSGSTTGPANTYGYYDVGSQVKAIEDSATAGVNFSQNVSNEFTYTENGVLAAMPTWIAQDIDAPASGTETGVYRYPNKVNTFSFSYWCADCHNLNIGGSQLLAAPELGFKAHTERTHPSPFIGAYDGPGQCYSCHRNDLSTVFGGGSVYGGSAEPAALLSGCTQCHYGTYSYYNDRADGTTIDSDFPHSGTGNSIKLLGDYSITDGDYTQLTQVTITENNLDAVCLRCHPGIEDKNHGSGSGGGTGDHSVPAEYASCLGCHPGADVTVIHASAPSGCDSCHAGGPLTNDCGTCHPDKLLPHGYEPLQHAATPGSGLVLIYAAGTHDSAMIGDGEVLVDCDTCHGTDLGAVHGDQCSTCHPSPVDTLGSWSGGCQQGGCHTTYHEDSATSHYPPPGEPDDCTVCHESPLWNVPASNCANCHATYNPADSTPPVTSSDALALYVGTARINFSITDGGLVGVGTTFWRVDGGPTNVGSSATIAAPGPHTIEFWSVDQAGNVETPPKTASFTITADTTPPVTTSNTQPTYTGNANITLTATDNGTSGVQATYYQIDGGPTQTGTSVFVPRVGSGSQPHTLTFWSEDYSGNVETPTTVNFTIVGLGTIRLVWWDADVNPSHAPGANEWANWTIRAGGSSGPIVASGSGTGPWDGVDDEVVPVSATPYYVYIYYQYWDPDLGFFEQDSTVFPSVTVSTPGEVVTLHY